MAMADKQINALGGGGFSTEPENPALDLYVLEQAATPNPAVCFAGTAAGDADRYIVNFYSAFTRYDCRPSHLSFFDRTPDIRESLLKQDVIYVGGGNTKSLLGVWREWGLPQILREAWDSGVVLAGISAGAVCWFEQGVSDSYAGSLTLLDCLGFLKGAAVLTTMSRRNGGRRCTHSWRRAN
jgi:peptidase E